MALIDSMRQFFGAAGDGLTPIMEKYFYFEQQKQGLQLADAELQQMRLQNAINAEQQVFQNAQQTMKANDGTNWVPLLLIGGVGLAVGLMVAK